jgi:regulator of RNase E activity RraA/CMP-N-acetylneuraminic acid synthetase
MKTVIFVPAKGHSERIPNKNLSILDGEHLFKRKLRQALECKEVDEVWLDSESNIIHELASDLPIKHLHRDPLLATNSTDGHAMFSNETQHTNADIVVQILCTAPFIDAAVIDAALKKFKQSDKTSLVGVFQDKFYEWKNNKPTYGDHIPNSVDLPLRTIEAMSFYAVKTFGKKVNKRYTNDVLMYSLTSLQSIDINNKEDLELAENICAGQRLKKIQQLKVLSKIISSPLLSDICKELSIPHFLSEKIKPLSAGNFLGYAKTLKIKALPDDQKDPNKKDWKGIFDALKTYEFIVPGDVIVVSTEVPDKAYFGDLNATFAVRQGAVGVVVDGYTRDVERVSKIGLPVYAYGSIADDVRYEGTFETMNMPVKINGITIRNNDIIFADNDGAICIPQEKWNTVILEVKTNLKKEMLVKLEATFGADPFDVLNNVGLF